MDLQLLDATLAQMLNDPNGKTYPPSMRAMAEALAVRAYSRWIAYKRRFGTGALYIPGQIGQNNILTVGGPFIVGSIITLDALTPWSETFTVTNVQRADSDQAPFVGTPLSLTLSGNMVNYHPLPTTVTQVNFGLTTVIGQDTYVMPYDFLDPDTETWDMAIGSRRWIKRQETFYDGVYSQSQAIFGVDYGMAQNFTGSPGIGTGLFGGGFLGITVPDGSPAIGPISGGSNETLYTFIQGDATILLVSPAPNRVVTYDFQYYAQQQPSTIPDADLDALADAAQGACYETWAAYLGGLIDFKEDYITEYPSQNTAQLKVMAQNKKNDFLSKVRNRPYATSG